MGIIGNGQSLSVGCCGHALTTTQPFRNLKLSGPALPDGALLSLVPLVEPIRLPHGVGEPYPNNILGESPHSSMANQLSTLALARDGAEYVTIHAVVGWGGHCMDDIDKEGAGPSYPASLAEARAFKRLADAEGKTLAFGAVLLTHGECDAPSAGYEAKLYEMWKDYDADLRAITGQRERVVLLVSQQHTYPVEGMVAHSTLAQWSAGVHHPGEIACIGPTYQYVYAGDHVHLDAASYRRLGEKYAEVFDQVVRQGKPWRPLQPSSVRRDGLEITVTFDVPKPPLTWDETLAPPHQEAFTAWAKGRGFEVTGTSGPVSIAGVRIAGDAVVITLASAPRTSPLTVRYATVQDAKEAAGGTALGRRGQLRDSDAFVGWDAETLPCTVEHGAALVTTAGDATFARRTLRDVVAGAELAPDTIVTARTSSTVLTLSSPWTGPSGTANLSFRYDQRNYAVAFQLSVP